MSSFSWATYLQVAQGLDSSRLVNCDPESRKRSAISRDYYAAFHAAEHYLQMQDKWHPKDDKEGVHAYAIKTLKGYGDEEVETAGEKLNSLRWDRVHADYRSNPIQNIDSKTLQAMSSAKKIVETFGKLEKALLDRP